MVEPIDPAEDVHATVLFEVWLAERELLSAAVRLRDLVADAVGDERLSAARIGYQAAWLRFMVSLCNLPLADRPEAVDRALDALRVAHALRADGIPPMRDAAHPTPPSPLRLPARPFGPETPPESHPPVPPPDA
jgi:hypothetical protein